MAFVAAAGRYIAGFRRLLCAPLHAILEGILQIKQALGLQQGRRQDELPSKLFRTFAVYIKLNRRRMKLVSKPTMIESPLPHRSAVNDVQRVAGNVVVLACSGFVLLGAVYFGLASCGGLAWYKEAFRGASFVAYVVALVLPSSILSSAKAKITFALVLPVSYVLLESAVAPFYPGPPDSVAAYVDIFFQALEYGPCR